MSANDFKKLFNSYNLLRLVYIVFLIVLMPHTAWGFAQFQEDKTTANLLAWMLAFSVESVVYVFTHKLAEKLTRTRRAKGFWNQYHRWANGYSIGLSVVLFISSIANFAYTVQFAGALTVFGEWGIPKGLYEFAFGAMLPFVSLVFALVLSQMADAETEANPELEAAKVAIVDLRRQLGETKRAAQDSEQARIKAVERFETVTDIANIFLSDSKTERIKGIHSRWSGLPQSSIVILADSSPAQVSEVIKNFSKN